MIHILGDILSLKLLKTGFLSSIKTIFFIKKRYTEVEYNCFFLKMNLILTWLLLLLIGSKFESNDEQLTYASQILDLKFDHTLQTQIYIIST